MPFHFRSLRCHGVTETRGGTVFSPLLDVRYGRGRKYVVVPHIQMHDAQKDGLEKYQMVIRRMLCQIYNRLLETQWLHQEEEEETQTASFCNTKRFCVHLL